MTTDAGMVCASTCRLCMNVGDFGSAVRLRVLWADVRRGIFSLHCDASRCRIGVAGPTMCMSYVVSNVMSRDWRSSRRVIASAVNGTAASDSAAVHHVAPIC